MEFPKMDFTDENACYEALVELLHPAGLRCPSCGRHNGLHVHSRHNHSWVVNYRCSGCHHKFSPWAGTVIEGTHHSPSELWRIMERLTAGWTKTAIADELGCQRARLSEFCHRIAPFVWQHFGPAPKKHSRTRAREATSRPPSFGQHSGHAQSQPLSKRIHAPADR